jgi:hypothetical protein
VPPDGRQSLDRYGPRRSVPSPAARIYCAMRWTRRQLSTAKRLCSFCSFGPKYPVASAIGTTCGWSTSYVRPWVTTVAFSLARTSSSNRCVRRKGGRQESSVVVLNRYYRRLVAPTRTASNVTDDRSAGLLLPSGSHRKWPCHLREPAQGSLDGSVHDTRDPTCWPRVSPMPPVAGVVLGARQRPAISSH